MFVKEGAKELPKQKRVPRLLHSIQDWMMLVDLKKQLKFPHFIFSTKLRPDMVLYSITNKTVVMVELTCPSEENVKIWHEENKQEPMWTCDKLQRADLTYCIARGIREAINTL